MKEFIRENKWKAIISSVTILLPMLVGILLWNRLPEQMASHWGFDGIADGLSTRAFIVFGLPLLNLALHWFCLAVTAADAGNKDQSKKAMGLLFWIVPVISWISNGFVYSFALGREFDSNLMLPLFMALLFIVFGNYMPKVKQNMTFGIKVHWALYDEENWNMTHRFGGKLWVIGGIVLLFAALLPTEAFVTVMVLDLLAMAVAPIVYSYLYYRKQCKAGKNLAARVLMPKFNRLKSIIGAVLGIGILGFVAVMLFTGDITFTISSTELVIEADYYDDLSVSYEKIDSIEFRETHDPGLRTYGVGSPRLTMGSFTNEEFGNYTRYAYTGVDACIIIYDDGHVLLITGKSNEQTYQMYQCLIDRLGE